MPSFEISISIASEWPTREDLKARDRLEAALSAERIGIVVGAGGGMGKMDLAYRIDDETKIRAVRELIDQLMKAQMPDYQYEIAVCQD